MSSDFPPNDPPMAEAVSEPAVSEPGYQEMEYGPPSSSGEGCKWIAIGCFVTALVLLLVSFIAGFWIYKNTGPLIAKGAVTIAENVVEEMNLPPEQGEQVVERIRDLGDKYNEGEIDLEDLVEVGEELAKDEDVITAGAVYFVDSQVMEQAPIDEELRAEVRRMTQRLARGVIEDQIELEDLKPLMEGIVKETPDGFELDPDVSQEDIVKVLESARTIADEAEIPDEPYEVDLMKEVNEVIDSVLEK